MPTYEYNCATCDRNFDVVQSFSDDPLEACPTCDSPVRKVFGNVGIVFKGSGFYKTDSRTTGGSTTAPRTPAESAGASSPTPGGDSPASGSAAPAAAAAAASSAPAASSATGD